MSEILATRFRRYTSALSHDVKNAVTFWVTRDFEFDCDEDVNAKFLGNDLVRMC